MDLKTDILTVLKELKIIFPRIKLTVKIKKLKNKNNLAVYRSGTAAISYPIVWVNENFYNIIEMHENIVDEQDHVLLVRQHLKDTLCHELIHVIQELNQVHRGLSIIKVIYDEDEAEELGIKLSRGESIAQESLIEYFNSYAV